MSCEARVLDCRCGQEQLHVQLHRENEWQDVHACRHCHARWTGTFGEHDFRIETLPFSMRLSRYNQPMPRWTA